MNTTLPLDQMSTDEKLRVVDDAISVFQQGMNGASEEKVVEVCHEFLLFLV